MGGGDGRETDRGTTPERVYGPSRYPTTHGVDWTLFLLLTLPVLEVPESDPVRDVELVVGERVPRVEDVLQPPSVRRDRRTTPRTARDDPVSLVDLGGADRGVSSVVALRWERG